MSSYVALFSEVFFAHVVFSGFNKTTENKKIIRLSSYKNAIKQPLLFIIHLPIFFIGAQQVLVISVVYWHISVCLIYQPYIISILCRINHIKYELEQVNLCYELLSVFTYAKEK